MNKLYIALLIYKKNIGHDCYLCEGVGPIVGLLFGNHFLSSHSKKYIPMLKKNLSFENQDYYEIEEDDFFHSKESYAYYELMEIEEYSNLEKMIKMYKEKYDKVCYFVDFSRTTPIMIRYKKI